MTLTCVPERQKVQHFTHGLGFLLYGLLFRFSFLAKSADCELRITPKKSKKATDETKQVLLGCWLLLSYPLLVKLIETFSLTSRLRPAGQGLCQVLYEFRGTPSPPLRRHVPSGARETEDPALWGSGHSRS